MVKSVIGLQLELDRTAPPSNNVILIATLLNEEHDALAIAEDALAEARCALECAQLEWDLARYQVRALEVA